jgi:hypothetical protein
MYGVFLIVPVGLIRGLASSSVTVEAEHSDGEAEDGDGVSAASAPCLLRCQWLGTLDELAMLLEDRTCMPAAGTVRGDCRLTVLGSRDLPQIDDAPAMHSAPPPGPPPSRMGGGIRITARGCVWPDVRASARTPGQRRSSRIA